MIAPRDRSAAPSKTPRSGGAMPVKKVGLMDALFLALESRESMMHVGGLLVFSQPPDAGPMFLRELADRLRDDTPAVQPPWNLVLRRPEQLKNPLQGWVEDTSFDLDYHVRRSALPAPGDERELGILVSRLHGIPMDFHRPLWEVHFIEGLERGRFALYFKLHHALLDGYTGMRLLAARLATDPSVEDAHMPYDCYPRPAPPADDGDRAGPP